MATVSIYRTVKGGHFAPAPVKVNKFPADLSQTREVKFLPLAADGATAVKVTRQTVSRETFAAWLAESDPKAREKLLADAESHDHKSGSVSPTREQIALMRELLDMPTAVRLASEGIVIRVSTRGDDSAEGKARKAKLTEAEKAAAAFALMFPEPVADSDGTEPTEPTAEDSAAGADDASLENATAE